MHGKRVVLHFLPIYHRHFFREKNIVHVTTAYWVKVTLKGDPLVPLSCPSRETYHWKHISQVVLSALWLASLWRKVTSWRTKRIPREEGSNMDSSGRWDMRWNNYRERRPAFHVLCVITRVCCAPFPLSYPPFPITHENRTANCFPSCLSFACLLNRTLPSQYRGLELFARQLRPFWLSVGNEVLLFQNSSLFKRTRVSLYMCLFTWITLNPIHMEWIGASNQLVQWPPNSSSLFNEHRSFSPSALGSIVFLRAFSLSFYIVCVFVNRSVIDAFGWFYF